jgi:hypothetical protein
VPGLAFPSDSPTHATGPGAIVWSTSRSCPGGEGAWELSLGAGGVPAPAGAGATPPPTRLPLRGPLALAGAPHGAIAIVGRAPLSAREQLLQGPASGPFSPLQAAAGAFAPVALASAYLGDVALAAPSTGPSGGLLVRVERHYARSFGQRGVAGRGPASAPTVALDYRGDALAVWEQAGALYARDLPASGPPHAAERLAAAQPDVSIAALLSDDNRAIVAWSEDRGGSTSVHLDLSAVGVRFGAPRLLERFADPEGLSAPAASPRLVRLRSESVMMAWAGEQSGHWVVRTAAVDLLGLRSVTTLAAAGGDALLAGLASAPDGGALALWTEPQQTLRGGPDLNRQALMAAAGVDERPGLTVFGQPEEVAPPGPTRNAQVAFDPATDGAVALWQGQAGALRYALRSARSQP